jgi:hypothetical protein
MAQLRIPSPTNTEEKGKMASFELIYEAEEDVLEVTFTTFDEHFARTLILNDNIILYTDTSVRNAWGLTLYSYAQLLQVSETHLDNLRGLPDEAANQILAVLRRPPMSAFFTILDPTDFRALIKAPGLQQLI